MPEFLRGSQADDIRRAATIVRGGGVLVVPTDTLYGLAASIFHLEAVERIYQIKRRPSDMRVPILLATAADLSLLTEDVPSTAWPLIDRFWPGPLTLVFRARPAVPRALTRGGATIAARVPAGRTILQLLEAVGEPVTGTSANLSGQPPVQTAAEALDILEGVDGVLEDDASIVQGTPSTVVDLTGQNPVVTRLGAVDAEALRRALGPRARLTVQLTVPMQRS